MEIREFDGEWEEVIKPADLNNIKSDGITIRTGNQVLKLTVTDTVSIPEDDIKKEYDSKYNVFITDIKKQFEIYKKQLSFSLNKKKEEYEKKKSELRIQLKKINTIPNITREHANKGLTVVNGNNGGLVWYYNCVYQPKYINKKVIDPNFAKRLMTPVTLEITTNENNVVTLMKIVKIIGHEKFQHYHSLSNTSDCWGDFDSTGRIIDDPNDAIKLSKDALAVLETINEFSLGKRNPKGLSRFDTLIKHIQRDDIDKNSIKHVSVNSRNSRTGFDQEINNSNTENIWSTNV